MTLAQDTAVWSRPEELFWLLLFVLIYGTLIGVLLTLLGQKIARMRVRGRHREEER